MTQLYDLSSFKFEPIFENIVGDSAKITAIKEFIKKFALSSHTVLITGETGTGKELVAKAIHNLSGRKNKPFVVINCAAIPATLLLFEFFGNEKDTFVEEHKAYKRIGMFEEVDDGTIFLDGISELPLGLQNEILKVLEEGKFVRIGGNKSIEFRARVIAATNRDLTEAIKNGTFREDLYYRLNMLTLSLPPLRERKEDIPLLISYFTDRLSKELDKEIKYISKKDLDEMRSYNWPGNVRELENTILRAISTAKGNILELELPPSVIQARIFDFEVIPFTFLLEPGSANEEEIADIFIELSTLYRKMGGNGLQFTFVDHRDYAKNKVIS